MSDTPRTDKFYDMVSDREAPGYSMIGHLPSKWSYEAILDFLDYSKGLERELSEAKADAAAVRELMNVYNLGGWTDAVEPMKRALRAESASLIKAAPDLLAALQHCLREHGGYTIKGETERLARAAIAKATGKLVDVEPSCPMFKVDRGATECNECPTGDCSDCPRKPAHLQTI